MLSFKKQLMNNDDRIQALANGLATEIAIMYLAIVSQLGLT